MIQMTITHRFEQKGKSKTGWAELSMVLEVTQLDRITIDSLPRYLIQHIGELAPEIQKGPTRMHPIIVEQGDGLKLSERLLWQLVIENNSEAEGLVIEYIDKLCECFAQNDDILFFNAEEHFAGCYALFEYLDYFFETDISTSPGAAKIYDCFFRHLQACDLDFEVYQDEYISTVLRKLGTFDEDRYLELLYFRLFNGQSTMTDKDHIYLTQTIGISRLKKVIDFIIGKESAYFAKGESPPHTAREILYLLAAVYGSNEDRIEEVKKYISNSGAIEFKALSKNLMKRIRRIQNECDFHMGMVSPQEEYYDSGFHKYDSKTKAWLPADMAQW